MEKRHLLRTIGRALNPLELGRSALRCGREAAQYGAPEYLDEGDREKVRQLRLMKRREFISCAIALAAHLTIAFAGGMCARPFFRDNKRERTPQEQAVLENLQAEDAAIQERLAVWKKVMHDWVVGLEKINLPEAKRYAQTLLDFFGNDGKTPVFVLMEHVYAPGGSSFLYRSLDRAKDDRADKTWFKKHNIPFPEDASFYLSKRDMRVSSEVMVFTQQALSDFDMWCAVHDLYSQRMHAVRALRDPKLYALVTPLNPVFQAMTDELQKSRQWSQDTDFEQMRRDIRNAAENFLSGEYSRAGYGPSSVPTDAFHRDVAKMAYRFARWLLLSLDNLPPQVESALEFFISSPQELSRPVPPPQPQVGQERHASLTARLSAWRELFITHIHALKDRNYPGGYLDSLFYLTEVFDQIISGEVTIEGGKKISVEFRGVEEYRFSAPTPRNQWLKEKNLPFFSQETKRFYIPDLPAGAQEWPDSWLAFLDMAIALLDAHESLTGSPPYRTFLLLNVLEEYLASHKVVLPAASEYAEPSQWLRVIIKSAQEFTDDSVKPETPEQRRNQIATMAYRYIRWVLATRDDLSQPFRQWLVHFADRPNLLPIVE